MAQSPLAAAYVLEIRPLIERHLGVPTTVALYAGAEDVPGRDKISLVRASWRWWNLAVFADHAPLQFPLVVPSIIILHGIVRSRQFGDGSYQYDRRRILRRGKPVYDVMAEVSDASKIWASKLVPEVADRIVVIGDLKSDRVLRAAAGTMSPDRLHIVVMSTWGPHSLMEAHGVAALEHLRALADTGSFEISVVTTHPNLWLRRGKPWQRRLEALESHPRVTILPPGRAWEGALAQMFRPAHVRQFRWVDLARRSGGSRWKLVVVA